ncbi:MAG TPA: segregation/condensation protein A [Phycisphaerae bacterium]|nr:segregation/condensation protein A [Phycisphaerae bacterium]HNU44112.1 segregation/condensation protein A [Phycisphaerae bacterium]
MPEEYQVKLDVYNGPLDLLLYLIRREEIDIYDIPIARITEQYLAYVEVLARLDPETVSEFLVLAATLMEVKSRLLLPRPPVEEGEEDLSDPRLELVRQLLEYKKYKDAARELEEAAAEQQLKHARVPALPPVAPDELELENLEIWDLFEAFNRLLEQIGRAKPFHQVETDDTPLTLHADDILDALQRAGGAEPFHLIFAGRNKAEMIGLFLALLELIRQRRIRVSQDRPFGTILIHLLDATPLTTLAENLPATDAPPQPEARPASAGTEGLPPESVAREAGVSAEEAGVSVASEAAGAPLDAADLSEEAGPSATADPDEAPVAPPNAPEDRT